MPTTIEDAIHQTRPFVSAKVRASVNLLFTYGWLADRMRTLLKPHGLTHQQYNVLRILNGSHPTPLCASEIKQVMLDKSPDVTRLCDRLAAKGLLVRRNNLENKREVHTNITPEGIALIDRVAPAIHSTAGLQHPGLTDKEANQLSALLDKMRG